MDRSTDGGSASFRPRAICYLVAAWCVAALASSAACGASPRAQTAGWQPEVRLTNDIADSSAPPNNCKYVAVDHDGNVHVVWLDERDRNYEIYHKMRSNGIWSADDRLTSAPGTSARPNLAVDASGLVHLAWNDERDGNMEIYHRYWTEGAWSKETRVTDTPGDSFASSIVAIGDTLHMVYMETIDTTTQIVYRTYRHFAWSPAQFLTGVPTGRRMVPTIAAGRDGSIHVAWWDTREDSVGVLGKIYCRRLVGNLWLEEELLTNPMNDAMRPNLAVDDSGFVHVVWIDARTSDDQIYHRRRGPAGWEPENRVTNETVLHYHPSIAAARGDVCLVYWDSHVSDSNTEVFFKRRTAGSWWGPTRISEGPASSDLCCLVAEPNGNLHVAWADMRDGNREIYYREYVDPANGTGGGGEHPPPMPALALGASPNPFRGETRLSLSLPDAREASVTLYGIDGRRVRALFRGALGGGVHSFVWDGRGERGERLAPGMYFAIARAGKARLAAKLVMIR